jgi:aspartate/methionine/tyrosine aminotransferase
MIERNELYQQRRDLVVYGLRAIGLATPCAQATPYVWARLPDDYGDLVEFSRQVLNQVRVWVSSGIFFGRQGEGYVRASLTVPTENLCRAMERLQGFEWW